MNLSTIVEQRSQSLPQMTTGAEEMAHRESLTKLQQCAETKRLDYENTLLKEALALSSESCEELMRASVASQVQAERNRQSDYAQTQNYINELKQSVERLNSSNNQLASSIDSALVNLTCELKKETSNVVGDALADNIKVLNTTTKSVQKVELLLCDAMQQNIRQLEQMKKKLFATELLKMVLFSTGCTCSILSLGLMVLQLYLHV